MSVLDDLEALIEKGDVSFVTVGRSTINPGRRHASLCLLPTLRFSQGYGDTCEAAVAEAIANAFKRGIPPVPISQMPVQEEPAANDGHDDLDDLLG